MNVKSKSAEVMEIDVDQLARWMEDGEVTLIDVRERFEHAAERIPGAVNRPASSFDPDDVVSSDVAPRVVLHCRTGVRSERAARRLSEHTGGAATHLAGGIVAWKQSGRATERSERAPRIDIMRQVQIAAGSLVLIGVALGAFVSPWFLVIAAFVGAGLVFAGATGWCGMAKLLSRMPWNT